MRKFCRRSLSFGAGWLSALALTLALLLALALHRPALAGEQQYERLSDSMRAALHGRLGESDLPPARWYFGGAGGAEGVEGGVEGGAAWLAEMSSRLRRILPSWSPYSVDARLRRDLLKSVHYEATRAGLDPQLVLAVIHAESAFRKYAISTAGARGLMQVMPFWVDLIGDKKDSLFKMRTNLRYGTTILRHYLWDREKGDMFRALGRYNGSLGRARYPRLVYAKLDQYWRY